MLVYVLLHTEYFGGELQETRVEKMYASRESAEAAKMEMEMNADSRLDEWDIEEHEVI